ncbi:MAG: Fic family protein, partial [Gemmatimonadota bacterium]|nr:Fic family protein [Gemmatimonadota bacterium]
MADYKWSPIKALSDQDRGIDLAAIQPLYDSWRSARTRLKESSPTNLDQFYSRLVRRLSVETGILERLYDLDRGTTEALVAAGFVEDLVTRSSTDIEPSRLIDILRDHEGAIQLVIECVGKKRKLSKGVLHELHAILTRHQETTTAVDQFGNRFEIPLIKGQFKTQANNPRRPDGSIHEYCPPIHVESEVENLLAWLDGYRDEDPIILTAWFHHRFTQIHPYQDGNGRVTRALSAYLLLRSDLLPLIIDRDLRLEYISALERADFGDLIPLASMFAKLERLAILQALSIDVDAEVSHNRSLTSAVIESMSVRFSKRREEKFAALRKVNELAKGLRTQARSLVEQALQELKIPLSEIGDPDIHVTEGGPDRENSHWYKYDVIKSGEASAKFINFDEEHYFLKTTVRLPHDRLVFVVSIHHVGRELSGIMEATAFARLEAFEDSDAWEQASRDF